MAFEKEIYQKTYDMANDKIVKVLGHDVLSIKGKNDDSTKEFIFPNYGYTPQKGDKIGVGIDDAGNKFVDFVQEVNGEPQVVASETIMPNGDIKIQSFSEEQGFSHLISKEEQKAVNYHMNEIKDFHFSGEHNVYDTNQKATPQEKLAAAGLVVMDIFAVSGGLISASMAAAVLLKKEHDAIQAKKATKGLNRVAASYISRGGVSK